MPEQLTPTEAVARLHPADSLGIPLGPGHPPTFLHALGARDDWTALEVSGALLTDLYAVFTKPGVRYFSGFFGPAERVLRDLGADIAFVPADFRRFAPILEALRPRVMATVGAPPDRDGHVSLSLHAGATVAELHRAGADPDRTLIVEVSDRFPRTVGLPPDHLHRLHLDEIDILVESDAAPFVLADAAPTEADRAIAEIARRFVHDGCTLQTGIGAIPTAVATLLADGPGGDYGIHSEMFTTGLMSLHRAGKIANRKGIFDGFSVTTFALGTPELYEWLRDNSDVRFLPVDIVNSPDVIARNHSMVSVNAALAVDLYGQAVADMLDHKQFSGIGGHEDFIAVSGHELEDRSLVCLHATATVDGEVRSRIVAGFEYGTVITTPRHHLDVVITEFGAAELRGRTVRQRALALAEIADPRFRDDLRARAAAIPEA